MLKLRGNFQNYNDKSKCQYMVNGIRANDLRGVNKKRDSKFRVGSRVRQEEGWETHRLKRCEYNNEDEDNSLKI